MASVLPVILQLTVVSISVSLSSEVWEQTQSGVRGDEKKGIFPRHTDMTTYRVS